MTTALAALFLSAIGALIGWFLCSVGKALKAADERMIVLMDE